jgi:parallel beta-helix repeat protein
MEIFGCVNNDIHENTIVDNDEGIIIHESDYTFISKNVITSNNRGIYFTFGSERNYVSNNSISNNGMGILQFNMYPFWHDNKHYTNLQIVHNEIINNEYGICIRTDGNFVSCNNFIDNGRQASFIATINNEWDANYWSDSLRGPYIIWGRIGIIFNLIPWIDFDYNPAQEPYDIGV